MLCVTNVVCQGDAEHAFPSVLYLNVSGLNVFALLVTYSRMANFTRISFTNEQVYFNVAQDS